MKLLPLTLLLFLVVSCNDKKEAVTTQSIIDKAIDNACNGNCETASIGFTFRTRRYLSQRNKGKYQFERILIDIYSGRGIAQDIETLERATHLLGPGNTFCAHAPGAMGPLESALRYFRADFEAYIN